MKHTSDRRTDTMSSVRFTSVASASRRRKRKSKKKRPGRLERHKITVEEKERLIVDLKGTDTKLKKVVLSVVAKNKSLKK